MCSGTVKYPVTDNGKETDLCFAITFRYKKDGKELYTFTLENTNLAENLENQYRVYKAAKAQLKKE